MSKAEIFNRIRAGLHVAKDDEVRRQAVRSRLQAKASNIIPKRAQLPTAEMMSLFLEMAKESAAEVIELGGRNELARSVENWLSENGIDHLVTANDSNLTEMSWSTDTTLIRERRPAQVGDEASLTNAFCAIAETGTVMLYSGEHSPTTLNFLPDIGAEVTGVDLRRPLDPSAAAYLEAGICLNVINPMDRNKKQKKEQTN